MLLGPRRPGLRAGGGGSRLQWWEWSLPRCWFPPPKAADVAAGRRSRGHPGCPGQAKLAASCWRPWNAGGAPIGGLARMQLLADRHNTPACAESLPSSDAGQRAQTGSLAEVSGPFRGRGSTRSVSMSLIMATAADARFFDWVQGMIQSKARQEAAGAGGQHRDRSTSAVPPISVQWLRTTCRFYLRAALGILVPAHGQDSGSLSRVSGQAVPAALFSELRHLHVDRCRHLGAGLERPIDLYR